MNLTKPPQNHRTEIRNHISYNDNEDRHLGQISSQLYRFNLLFLIILYSSFHQIFISHFYFTYNKYNLKYRYLDIVLVFPATFGVRMKRVINAGLSLTLEFRVMIDSSSKSEPVYEST